MLLGTDGDDLFAGTDGADVHFGRGGMNIVQGQGVDAVWGEDGDDWHANGNFGDDSVLGGNGNDTVFAARAPIGWP